MTPVHKMNYKERARYGVYINASDYRTLEDVSARLSSKYPADWFERKGKDFHIYVFAVLLFIAVGLSFGKLGVWAFLLPVFCTTVITCDLPNHLWGRIPGMPRWAHKEALLDAYDVKLVEAVAASLKPVQRVSISPFLPAITGERFWQVMWRAKAFKRGYAV